MLLGLLARSVGSSPHSIEVDSLSSSISILLMAEKLDELLRPTSEAAILSNVSSAKDHA